MYLKMHATLKVENDQGMDKQWKAENNARKNVLHNKIETKANLLNDQVWRIHVVI